jgi:hypothetical protein
MAMNNMMLAQLMKDMQVTLSFSMAAALSWRDA